jgi:MYXO-CTERM domain-containing protein
VTLSATDPTTVRFAVSDNAVTDDGPRLSRAFVQVGAAEIEATFMGGDIYRAVIPPTPETTFNPCAVDLAGNATTGCPGGTGEGGGGGGTTTGTTGTMGPGSGGGSNTGGQNAGGDGSGGGSGGDSGCSCSVPGDGRGRSPLLFLGFALAGIAVVSRARRSVRG